MERRPSPRRNLISQKKIGILTKNVLFKLHFRTGTFSIIKKISMDQLKCTPSSLLSTFFIFRKTRN